MGLVYLNGEFLPAEQACVPVLDRGFIFGDGIYELIPAYGGKLFRFAEHMRRLENNLTAVRIQNPLNAQQWLEVLEKVMAHNEGEDQAVYLQVTRGVAQRDHAMPDALQPTVFVMASPLQAPAPQLLEQGVSAVTAVDNRWLNCHIKSISLLANILLRQEAVDANAVEAILLRNGFVTEGAASNVFIVKQACLVTPPKGPNLLPGITRDLILELAAQNNIQSREAAISEQDLLAADEVWLSSSSKEILPVTRLNDREISEGRPGPVWRQVYEIYQNYKQSLRRAGQVATK